VIHHGPVATMVALLVREWMGKRMHDKNGSGGGVCVLSPSLTPIYGGGVCGYMGISSVFGRQSLLNFLVIGIYRLDKTI
jgi:hypothetical protein